MSWLSSCCVTICLTCVSKKATTCPHFFLLSRPTICNKLEEKLKQEDFFSNSVFKSRWSFISVAISLVLFSLLLSWIRSFWPIIALRIKTGCEFGSIRISKFRMCMDIWVHTHGRVCVHGHTLRNNMGWRSNLLWIFWVTAPTKQDPKKWLAISNMQSDPLLKASLLSLNQNPPVCT